MNGYGKYNDAELSEMFRNGDDVAFKEIYNRYNQLLYLFALRRLENEAEAMDIVQDVFVWLLKNRFSVALKTSLSSYLYKSVLNKILDIFRHQKIVRRYIESGDHYIEIDSKETDYLIREKDIAAMINYEIEQMPPRMREIYQLKYRDHMDIKEIASQLDISENTVKTQLQRGARHMRNKLGLFIYVLYILCR